MQSFIIDFCKRSTFHPLTWSLIFEYNFFEKDDGDYLHYSWPWIDPPQPVHVHFGVSDWLARCPEPKVFEKVCQTYKRSYVLKSSQLISTSTPTVEYKLHPKYKHPPPVLKSVSSLPDSRTGLNVKKSLLYIFSRCFLNPAQSPS